MDGIRPVILGYDMVSPLGTDMDAQWQRAVAGESGIGPLTRFDLPDAFPVRIAGEVPAFDESQYSFLSGRAMAHWTSPIFKHGMLVVDRAIKAAGIEITPDIAPRTAITFSTAIGGLDAVLDADRIMMKSGRLPSPFVNPNSCVNMITGKIAILTHATGPIVTTITACATGSTSIMTGAMFLATGQADVAICGAVDFPLVEPIVGGFATMNGAYKTKDPNEPPSAASRPFSMNRKGFIVSEGAAAVILATPDFARSRGLDPIAELAGWASTSDAYHFVAPNPETVGRCMKMAISHAGIGPGDVDAVNAHGTSTKVGDQVEARMLNEVFNGKPPPITANKSMIGHCMGASSAVESVLALRGMREGVLLPTINNAPDPACPVELNSESKSMDQEFVLKNAFGFGGANTCLVFRRMN